MKHPPTIYARAFVGALDENSSKEELLRARFLKLVKKNGDLQNFPKIIREIETLLIKKAGGRRITVEVAREISKTLLQELERNFKKNDKVEVKTNPALIAGTRITIDGEKMIDTSLERRLRKLFV